MKHSLLLVAVVALLAIAGPAYSQYMYLDVNNDGISDPTDVLTPGSTQIDVWIDTDTDRDGTPDVCNSGPEALTISSYEFVLRATGALTFGAWGDAMGFSILSGGVSEFSGGGDYYAGRASAAGPSSAGLYKLGSVPVSGVASGAVVSIVTSTTLYAPGTTSFGTACLGNGFDNTYRLNDDWEDAQGTYPPIPVSKTTWGKIKDLYK